MPRPVPLDVALPVLRDRCEARSADSRREATCRAGCDACCRHLVPVAPAEGRRLLRLLRALPEDRRAAVRRRWATTRARLEGEGVWPMLVEFAQSPAEVDADGRAFLARVYHAAEVDCPFLDAGRCSIYDERPLACRLQAVRSDPAECFKGPDGRVDPIRPPGRPPVAALAALEGRDWVPLITLLNVSPPAPPAEADEWESRLDAELAG